MSTDDIEAALADARKTAHWLEPALWAQVEAACLGVIEALKSGDPERIRRAYETANELASSLEAAWTAWALATEIEWMATTWATDEAWRDMWSAVRVAVRATKTMGAEQ